MVTTYYSHPSLLKHPPATKIHPRNTPVSTANRNRLRILKSRWKHFSPTSRMGRTLPASGTVRYPFAGHGHTQDRTLLSLCGAITHATRERKKKQKGSALRHASCKKTRVCTLFQLRFASQTSPHKKPSRAYHDEREVCQ